MQTFIHARIVTPDGIRGGSLTTDQGKIIAIGESVRHEGEIIDIEGGFLLPGFIDTQVNGGGGVLFNDDPSPETIATIGQAHRQFGTTGFLPTLISDRPDKIEAALHATETAISQGVSGVLGLHIEGPFINSDKKGIHDKSVIRKLDRETIARLKGFKSGRLVITLAPETCDLADISELAEAGIIVSAGHTNARYEDMVSAFKAGVTGITHLFNAMSPLLHRAPGVVGAALENQSAYCGLIADGHHVDWSVLRIALKCRPYEKFMLVSDAMSLLGSSKDSFELNGRKINLKDGICTDEAGVLAGSNLDLGTAVRHMVQNVGVPIEQAAYMAATAPAHFLNLHHKQGALTVGLAAHMVWMDESLNVKAVYSAV